MVRRGEIDNFQSLGTAIYTRPMVRRRAKSLKALVFKLPEDTPDDELPGRPRGPSSDRPPFLPISADYRVGGRFQFEGNAGGRDPRLLKAAPAPRHLGLREGQVATSRATTRSSWGARVCLPPIGACGPVVLAVTGCRQARPLCRAERASRISC